jgi:C-terminal processing protease CtpA/Prc
MVAGKMIVPPANAFGPCFTIVEEQERPFVLGFDDMRLGVVRNLVAGSPAAQAGVKEGDSIIALTPLGEVRDDPAKTMELTIRRDGRDVKISYLPRGAAVPAWHWVRDSKVPDSECRL